MGLQLRELLLEEDKWNDFVKNIDRDINNSGIIPSFESIRQASTYACDFVYSFLSQFYHINFIILSSSVSETNAMVIKKIFSDESPTFILAHFGNVEHFEPKKYQIQTVVVLVNRGVLVNRTVLVIRKASRSRRWMTSARANEIEISEITFFDADGNELMERGYEFYVS